MGSSNQKIQTSICKVGSEDVKFNMMTVINCSVLYI